MLYSTTNLATWEFDYAYIYILSDVREVGAVDGPQTGQESQSLTKRLLPKVINHVIGEVWNFRNMEADTISWKQSHSTIPVEPSLNFELCRHCGLVIPTELSGTIASGFCCSGCETVYRVLHGLGLERYYSLKSETDELGTSSRVSLPDTTYAFLDDPELSKQYLTRSSSGLTRATFRLVGIHCAACIWLLEKLPEICRGVIRSQVSFTAGTISVEYDEQRVLLSEIARKVALLGYPMKALEEGDLGQRKVARTELLRIGIAAFCAMNVMMLATALYQGWFSGIEQNYLTFFLWGSLVVSIPSVCYCAIPFYRTAFGALRTHSLHIDLPISFAIICAFIVSAANTVRGINDVYFDSIAVLIFLLLSARSFQRGTLDRSWRASNPLWSLLPMQSLRKTATGMEEVYVGSVKAGDILEIPAKTIFPADGVILSGASFVRNATLTGESYPASIGVRSEVFAGTENLAAPVTMEVFKPASESRFARVLQLVDEGANSRSPIVDLTNRMSGRFVAVVLTLSVVCFSAWGFVSGLDAALRNTLALLVVTCPCALGLAAPIGLSLAIRRAAKRGILIRGAECIESLAAAEVAIFDKTGTITEGAIVVTDPIFLGSDGSWGRIENDSASPAIREALEAIESLESGSAHPVGVSLLQFAKQSKPPTGHTRIPLISKEDRQGRGISGRDASGSEWHIGSLVWFKELGISIPYEMVSAYSGSNLSVVCLAKDRQAVGLFGLGDAVRSGMVELLAGLRSRSIETLLLSGDGNEITTRVGAALGFSSAEIISEASPERKLEYVQARSSKRRTVFIGDGANDAGALCAATVGVGVSGGAELTLQLAGVFLMQPTSEQMAELFLGARQTMNSIKKTLMISSLYNLSGATLALFGLVTPIVAAVLMPISSLTVVFLALSSRSFRQ